MLTNPNTCGIFEPEVAEIAEAVHAAGALLLLRRRQPQRHHGQGEAGRARRRRHAHQPAQDLLHAAWRRRSGRRAGGAVGGARALRAGAVRRRATATTFRLVEHAADAGDAQSRSAACRAFHGQMGMFVRAYAWMLAHGSDGMRQASEDAVLNANYIRAGLKDMMTRVLPRPSGDARGAVRRPLPEGHRRHHARFRQGDDRRGLSSDDGVFPAGRARRDAGRADGIGIAREPRSLHRRRSAISSSRRRRATASASAKRRASPRAAASTRPAPPASRC